MYNLDFLVDELLLEATKIREFNYREILASDHIEGVPTSIKRLKLKDKMDNTTGVYKKRNVSNLVKIKKNGMLIFKTTSSDYPKLYTQKVFLMRLKEAIEDYKQKKTYIDVDSAITMAIKSDLKMDCNCEDQLYQGKRFVLHQLGASLVPETRQPLRNDPTYSRNVICKHLFRVLSVLPFSHMKIKKEIKRLYNLK